MRRLDPVHISNDPSLTYIGDPELMRAVECTPSEARDLADMLESTGLVDLGWAIESLMGSVEDAIAPQQDVFPIRDAYLVLRIVTPKGSDHE